MYQSVFSLRRTATSLSRALSRPASEITLRANWMASCCFVLGIGVRPLSYELPAGLRRRRRDAEDVPPPPLQHVDPPVAGGFVGFEDGDAGGLGGDHRGVVGGRGLGGGRRVGRDSRRVLRDQGRQRDRHLGGRVVV